MCPQAPRPKGKPKEIHDSLLGNKDKKKKKTWKKNRKDDDAVGRGSKELYSDR